MGDPGATHEPSDGRSIPPGRSVFLSFEGIEGSGKTVQLARLAQSLQQVGVAVRVTREPGGTTLGTALRTLLLQVREPRIVPTAELLLYTADRAQHIAEVIEPALAAGRVVLCDRYLDATLAYQGFGREIGVERILALHREPPLTRRPLRTLLLDLPVGEALERARRRNSERSGGTDEGRFEAESDLFHERVRQGYLKLAALEPTRIQVIDGLGSEEAVARRIQSVVADLFPAAGFR